MSSYLSKWNITWTLISIATGGMFLLFIFFLPFLAFGLGSWGAVLAILLFGMLSVLGYTSYKVLLNPHMKSHSLIKKSKKLLKARPPSKSIGDFGQSAWNEEGMIWQYRKEFPLRGRRDLDMSIEQSMLKRLSADDISMLTQRDSLGLSINPFDDNKCNKVLHALVDLIQKGEWRPLSNLVSSIPTVRHINRSSYISYFFAFRRCLSFIGDYTLRNIDDLYCAKHYRRFVPTQKNGFGMAVCRQCKKTSFGMAAPQVALVVDRKAGWKTRFANDRFEVNFHQVDELPDFDLLMIGNHIKDDIEHLCIKVGNDTDTYRTNKYKSVYYKVQPGISMDRECIALISRFFSLDNSDVSPVKFQGFK